MNPPIRQFGNSAIRQFSLRLCVSAFVLLAVLGVAFAQIAKPPSPAATNRVKMAPASPVALRPGGNAVPVHLQFEVAPGFHINSNKPRDELLVPTVVKLHPPTDIAIAKITYPAGHDLTFAFAPGEKLSVYTGDFTVSALVSATRAMPPGRYRVHGLLKYQACDDKACYPPGQAPVAFDVQVSRASSTRRRHNPPQSPHVH